MQSVGHLSALHPLTFLPFHLANHHMLARTLPYRRITYPLHLIFSITQYLVEHFSAEFPTIASMNAPLVSIAISLAPYFYYRSYKTTTGPKSLVWASVAIFLISLPLFKGLELGFPKDDPMEEAAANKDVAHSYWHLVLHITLFLNSLLSTYHVPWNPQQPVISKVPASPKHRTLSTSPSHKFAVSEGCSPKLNVKSAFATWSKPKVA